MIRKWIGLTVLLARLVCAPAGRPADSGSSTAPSLLLATTTSAQDSGLLDALLPVFEQESGIRVKPIAVGSGAALALGARGEADALLVHAPAAELKWMRAGHGIGRWPVMHNEFVIVGPNADSAGVRSVPNAATALARIALTRTPWVSRDDGSGTDLLEKELWKESGHADLALTHSTSPHPWLIRSGQGMGATLMLADARQACTLTDRTTWLAWRTKISLVELVRGDPRLRNQYHVLTVRPAAGRAGRIHTSGASAFARWMTGPRAQTIIGSFGRDRHGEALFVPASSTAVATPVRGR